MANIPATVGQHLEAIQINGDGEVFLASSQLSYRYWTGSVWRFSNPEAAPDVERCDGGMELSCGVKDLKLIPNTQRLMLALDSGGVELLTVDKEGFKSVAKAVEHDDYVTSLSINANTSKAASSSQDKRIKIWDLQEFQSVHTFKGHSDCVHNVSFHPTQPSLFVSCSQDGRLVLWDLRQAKPATMIDSSALPSKPTCIEWQPASENGIVVGTESGDIVLMETKQIDQTTVTTKPHTRPIKRIVFNPKNPAMFATASEDSTAVVTEYMAGSANPIYRESGHCDFVQGLAWHPDGRLFTCGWDQRINKAVPHPNIEGEKLLVEGTSAVCLAERGSMETEEEEEEVESTTPDSAGAGGDA